MSSALPAAASNPAADSGTVEDVDAPLDLGDTGDTGGMGNGARPDDWADVLERYPALAEFRSRLGDTPLVEAPNDGGARILAKCEWANPAGSIKDRVAFAMVARQLRAWGDRPVDDLWLLEYSGGNLSVALARLARLVGARIRLVLSSASAPSLLAALDEQGADVDLVDKERGFLAVMERAIELARTDNRWTLLYQHRNTVNVRTHETTTGAEVLAALDASARPERWVASIGTGGTLVGVYRALRRRYPGITPVGVTPAELPYGSDQPPNGKPKYAGSGGLGNGIRQPFVRPHDADIEFHSVSYPDALAGMRAYRELTGVAIGSSAAANWMVAKRLAAELPDSATVLTVFPCAGTPEEWRRLGW